MICCAPLSYWFLTILSSSWTIFVLRNPELLLICFSLIFSFFASQKNHRSITKLIVLRLLMISYLKFLSSHELSESLILSYLILIVFLLFSRSTLFNRSLHEHTLFLSQARLSLARSLKIDGIAIWEGMDHVHGITNTPSPPPNRLWSEVLVIGFGGKLYHHYLSAQ